MGELAVATTPQSDLCRVVEHLGDQFIAPFQFVLVSDASQRANHTQPIRIAFVVENEVLAQQVMQHRHLQQIARQARQMLAFDQRIGLVQVQLQCAVFGKLGADLDRLGPEAPHGRQHHQRQQNQATACAGLALRRRLWRRGGNSRGFGCAHGRPVLENR